MMAPGESERTSSEIERVFREDYGRAVSVLVRLCGDIDDAEEAVQDAFRVAVERWAVIGKFRRVRRGWIIATARKSRHRSPSAEPRCTRCETLQHSLITSRATHSRRDVVRDDRPPSHFHVLSPSARDETCRFALTLAPPRRTFDRRDCARLSRARSHDGPASSFAPRARSATREFPYRVPDANELPGRMRSVLAVIYLLFNEGYSGELRRASRAHGIVS